MFKSIRNSKISKGLAVYFSLSLIFQIISPTVALALTSGPGQEEFASFEPASTSDMVDLYSGDYNYNIPLLSVPGPNGGYPINLAYHSGIGMEQEASWVGLGWNLNVGAITRNLRGLPDDFNGDQVKKTQHIKESVTASLNLPTSVYQELVGFPVTSSGSGSSASNSLQMYYNNYKGLGTRYTFSASGSGDNASAGLAISHDSQNGMGIGINLGAKSKFNNEKNSAGFELGANYSSRQGLQSFGFTAKGSNQTSGVTGSSSMSFATVFGVPKVNMETKSTTTPFMTRFPLASAYFRFRSPWPISGSVGKTNIENNGIDNVPAVGYLNTIYGPTVLKDFNRTDLSYSKKMPHLGTSSFTYDLYTQTGQGTGSMFRPHLNNFGVLSDPQKISKDRVGGLGIEVGAGTTATVPGANVQLHIGIDLEFGAGQNSSGPWTQTGDYSDYGGGLQNLVNWTTANTEVGYEPYYFQVIGEKTGTYLEDDQLGDFAGDAAVRLEMQKERQDKSFLTRHFKASDNLIVAEHASAIATVTGSTQTKQKPGDKRLKRSTSIETLTTAEAQQYGFSKSLQYREVPTTTPCLVPDPYEERGIFTPKDFGKPANHISEISMVQSDGMRYVYGLPAYNNKQVDNTFAITADAGMSANITDAAVNTGGSKNFGGINVTGTDDEFVSKNELPKYAHSWMLTTVLSADYLDMTNNGPTDDDFGYWVKFNYKKIAADYKWRIPYSRANYMDGFKNKPTDNKGSYTYGEKDLYVLESIETKTHVAVFETSCREDAIEAAGEYSNGTGTAAQGTKRMHKLDKIKLFTKREYTQTAHDAVPTKVINFEYSYDLCGEVANNSGTPKDVDGDAPSFGETNVNARSGKLTLTKLYFTYQNSTRGSLSPYVFNYGNINDAQNNPDYDLKDMDRWGNYKNHLAYEVTTGFIRYPYIDRPYTEQDPIYYDGNPGATSTSLQPAPWTLKEISLPTGGTLTMEYEQDDYAFVEDKQAMRMYDICHLDKPGGTIPALDDLSSQSSRRNKDIVETEAGTTGGGLNRVYFKLEQPMDELRTQLGDGVSLANPPTDKQLFYEVYLKNAGTHIYFNNYAQIRNATSFSADDVYDYVKGYAEIELTGANYGVTGVRNPDGLPLTGDEEQFGYFTLKTERLSTPVNTTGIWASPFTKAAIQHLKANRSELVFNAMPYAGSSAMAQIMALFTALPGQITDLMSTTIGFNNYAYARDWGKHIQLNGTSIIRLCEPDYKKIGGGVRIKKITLNDNWKNTTSDDASSLYGQEYSYTKKAMIAGKEVTISSGVAYEPIVGGEESALRSSIPYVNSIPLHGSFNLFMENPIMESYYPGAGVGYSKVTVKSIAPTQALAENASNPLSFSSAPITINEYYTPKDFPVVFDQTDMNPGQPIKIPIMVPGLLTSFTTRQAKSQGYSIITNDMAGKPKAVTTQTRVGGQIISKQKFIYNTESDYNENAVNKLSSKVQTLEVDKADNYEVKYRTSIVGQTHDMFFDMNEDAQEMESFGVEFNHDIHVTYPPPVFIFTIMPIPTVKVDRSSLRTVVFNKIINRTGIIKKVETTTNESKIITENLAYDIETGEPILTKVTNEFKDPVYNFSYPGHWYYPNLQGAYQNDGLVIDPPGSTVYGSDGEGYVNLTAALDASRPVSDYFAKGDLLYVDCTTDARDGEYHVYNINEAGRSIQLMNSMGYLFPPSVSILKSIKVLKSGFKNMQTAKVGSLVFKELNPTFKQYQPSDHAGTVVTTTPVDVFYSDLGDNKIVNASAIEYNNDWQVFCGPYVEPESTCVCTLIPAAYDFLSMLQQLKTEHLLFSNDVQIYDMVTNVPSHGFTLDLLNSNAQLVAAESTLVNQKFFYEGYLTGGGDDLEVLISHEISSFLHDENYAKVDCRMIIHLPSGTLWEDVESLSNIYKAPPAGSGPEEWCLTPTGILMDVVTSEGETVTATIEPSSTCATGCSNCWTFENCYTQLTPNYACGITDNMAINPFLAGMKGIWRPEASFAYNTSRTQANDLKTDGVYTDFVRFPWEDPSTKDAKWINATTVTKYSPYAFELENKDALGNYSSALYGYSQALVTAIGSNAMYKEIAFDNFEDYALACNDIHFRFTDDQASVTTDEAHTGKYSMYVGPSGSVAVPSKAVSAPCTFAPRDNSTYPSPDFPYDVDGDEDNDVNVAHVVESCDCLGEFSPLPNKKYVASVWVKELASAGPFLLGVTNYTAPELRITIALSSGGPTVYNFTPKGNVIDGWQQIFESFDIPSNATGITVELVNTLSNKKLYFDDIRLHPFDGNMVSYVYDPILLKTMAELDANNYATIYVYDDEGHLNKVKKETSEGIKTIKEGRINTKKLNE